MSGRSRSSLQAEPHRHVAGALSRSRAALPKMACLFQMIDVVKHLCHDGPRISPRGTERSRPMTAGIGADKQDNPMDNSKATKAAAMDRFGNPIDPVVGYARGAILQGTDEEVQRMLRARHMVGERVRRGGKDAVYDLSGMNRGSGITAEEV